MKGISLMGAHRTGKTTLAKAYAGLNRLNFISMSVAPAYERCNIPMGIVKDYTDRMIIQDAAVDIYLEQVTSQTEPFITDRCFLDLIAYALADYPQDPTEIEATWLIAYIYRCNALNVIHFNTTILLRPGIPLMADETSWSADYGVVAKVDACMLWVADRSYGVHVLCKNITEPHDRLNTIEVIFNAKI